MTVTRFIPPYLPQKDNYTPTHPDLFRIEFGKEEDYSSCLRTEKEFHKGDIICKITNTLPGIKKYSSVQVLPDPALPPSSAASAAYGVVDPVRPKHIELQSDLLYVNHSCDPNVAFEVPLSGDWNVRALKDLPAGEIMTFAYFTTEWSMDQPFNCLCKSDRCLGEISGAKSIPTEVLAKYQVNDHIKAMKAHQAEEST